MLVNTIVALVALVVVRAIWRVLSRYLLKSPLDNIPGPSSQSLFSGNFRQLFNPDAWAFHEELARTYGTVIRTTGLLGEKQLYISDPKALHHIVVKDQDTYEEHPQFIATNALVFGRGLLSSLGDTHKRQRKLMNPVFSTTHMRHMVPIFQDVVGALRASLEELTDGGSRELDMLQWISRTALELIGRSGLGYSFDSLAVHSSPHPYATSIKELAPAMFRLFFLRVYVLPIVHKLGPAWLRRAVIDVLPMRDVHNLRDKVDLMWATSKQIYSQKAEALRAGDEAVSKQIGQGNDILSLLIRANMKTDDPLDEDEVLGQMSTLIFAAMDTTSSALSRILYLLAQSPDVQERLRAEIRAAKKEHGVLTYDELESLTYLDAVCRETLRLFPSIPHLLRLARKDVILPFSRPVRGVDGRLMSDILVPEDTPILISIMNANRNPDIWGPDALEWKPERWLNPLPESVTDAHMPGVYSHMMTFLGGRRACIGFKFSQLEMKVFLVDLLDAFKLDPSKKDVKWRMSMIASPYLEDQPHRSQLPIVLSRAS
ncbi:cytochrome P450 [Schizophyllum fasciatum]